MHFEIDKNFSPEILRKLGMELKPYHIWHLKFGAEVPETIKVGSFLETRMCPSPLCKIFSTC